MSAVLAVVFVIGGFIGSGLGMLVFALGLSAKRNVSDMPELPLSTPIQR